jgi:hypothetical protein
MGDFFGSEWDAARREQVVMQALYTLRGQCVADISSSLLSVLFRPHGMFLISWADPQTMIAAVAAVQ